MIYRLVILNGDRRGERITVAQEPMSIGRGESCDIRFDDPEVASAHAEISHTAEGLVIRDLGSMNRLLVDSREVRSATLKHGAVVEVGRTRFLVQAYVQAEVQGESEEVRRHRRWITTSAVALCVLALLYGMYRCRPEPAAKPASPNRYTPAQRSPIIIAPRPAPPPTTNAPAPAAASPSPSSSTSQVEQATATPIARPRSKAPSRPPAEVTAARSIEPVETTWAATTSNMAGTAEDTIAVAQKELQDAANALLDSKVKEMMEEARGLATNKGPEAAVQLLEAIEKVKPDYVDAAAARAALLEEQGKLEPAMTLWEDILRRDHDTPLAAEARKRLEQLPRAKEQLVFPFVGHVKIVSADINKFPETEQFREMRLLTVRLTATEMQKELDASAVRVEFRFYDLNREADKISLTQARVPTNAVTLAGTWRATEERTVEASYIVPVVADATVRPEEYYGFVVRVYYYGALQDEWVQPKDLPADVELTVPAVTPATNNPASTPPGTNPS